MRVGLSFSFLAASLLLLVPVLASLSANSSLRVHVASTMLASRGAFGPPNCFPAIGFSMPGMVPASLTNWWCPPETEYGFVGFSYEISSCQQRDHLNRDFSNIRQKFKGRYVRIYGVCDIPGYYNQIIDAAWDAGIGVFAMIWFGFDSSNAWINRRDSLFAVLHSNPKARFITRALQFGSEPLFDSAISPSRLLNEVQGAKRVLAPLRIPVTVSELAYAFRDLHAAKGGGLQVLASLDVISVHILPFFYPSASTANNAWMHISADIHFFASVGGQRKIWLTQTGWPCSTSPGVQPNSRHAIASVQNSHDYYMLLDKHCHELKAVQGGGVGWFAHIYSDDMESEYGIHRSDGHLKFPFSPRIAC